MGYLRFSSHPSASGRTTVTEVHSVLRGDMLGEIRWMGRWRQYAFYPGDGTIWNPDCLAEVSAQIRALMEARKGSAA